MDNLRNKEITRILQEWNEHGPEGEAMLLARVYDELKRQARSLMAQERAGHTLQPTALVHEAFLKLGDGSKIEWKDRSHFYGIVSRMMRQILVDHARSKGALKRGSSPIHLSLEDVQVSAEQRANSIVAVNEVLDRFQAIDERQAKIVEMRFFGGMSNSEIAEALSISNRTVVREWQAARLWLCRELYGYSDD